MKRLLCLTLWLSFAFACDDGGAAFDPLSVDPTAETGDTGEFVGPASPIAGVQIGSEGIILTGCTLRTLESAEVPEGFSTGAASLTAPWSEEIDGILRDGEEDIVAVFNVSTTGWQAVEGEGCPARVVAEVSGAFSAPPFLSAQMTGFALVDPQHRAELSLWATAWEGTAMPDTDPAAVDSLLLGIEGDANPTELVGEMLFQACVDESCSDEPVGDLVFSPL